MNTEKHHCNLTHRTMPSWKMWFTTDSLFSLTPECQDTKSITEHARAQSRSTAFPEARHQHYWSGVGPKGRADILMSSKPGELFQNSAERKLQESTPIVNDHHRQRPPFGGGRWWWWSLTMGVEKGVGHYHHWVLRVKTLEVTWGQVWRVLGTASWVAAAVSFHAVVMTHMIRTEEASWISSQT